MTKAPPCLHCKEKARLTSGAEAYPRRPDLRAKPFWVCDSCGGLVGCHKGSNKPLGFPADKKTRQARLVLHKKRLDPLWLSAPKKDRKQRRSQVYAFLSRELGLSADNAHTGMFTIEQCREAWKALGRFEVNA